MPPKKGKGKKGDKVRKSQSISIVGKYFYEARIAELNHILSDLRTQQVEVEDTNESLLKTKEELIQDEKDIIAYLNRMTQVRTDEINRLRADCDNVERERIKDGEDFEAQKEQMQENYQRVEGQLLSDLKLTVGKMHALEEFRLVRDQLMQKYEELENATEDQKMQHKREIYEVERKFIIGDDKLKKEMDAKLKWLIEKFQAVTDLRVSATTQRVIKENIALNNMIEVKLHKLKKLYEVHEKLRKHDEVFKLMSHMTTFEANAMANQSRVLREEIFWLVNEYFTIQRSTKHARMFEPMIIGYQTKIKVFKEQIAACAAKDLILQQNLHEFRCQREDIAAQLRYEYSRNEELKDMLKNVASMIQSTDINDDVYTIFDQSAEEETTTQSKSTLLFKIFEFLKQVREWNRTPKPMELLENRSDIYMQGDIGLVPRQVVLKCMIPTMDEKAEQIDGSHDLLTSERTWEYIEEEIEAESEATTVEESVTATTVHEQETQTDVEPSSQSDSK